MLVISFIGSPPSGRGWPSRVDPDRDGGRGIVSTGSAGSSCGSRGCPCGTAAGAAPRSCVYSAAAAAAAARLRRRFASVPRRGRHCREFDQLDVEAERAHFLDEHVEALGNAGLEGVVAADDRLVDLGAAGDVVRLDGQHLLQRVGGAVGFERPHLHFAEALAAELRLAAQRLLGDEAVGTDRAGVDLVVDEVVQLQHVLVADRHLAIERLAGAAVAQRHLTRRVEARLLQHLDDVRLARAVEHRRRDRHAAASAARRARRARRPSASRLDLLARRRSSSSVSRSGLGLADRVVLLRAPRRSCGRDRGRPSPGASRGSGRRSCGSARRAD